MSTPGSRPSSKPISKRSESEFSRLEAIPNGGGRHRFWPDDVKAAIILETLREGASVSDVARRHDVSKSLVFKWRRKARVRSLAPASFASVAIATPEPARSMTGPGAVSIEMEADGVRVSIPANASREAILAVLEGLAACKRRR